MTDQELRTWAEELMAIGVRAHGNDTCTCCLCRAVRAVLRLLDEKQQIPPLPWHFEAHGEWTAWDSGSSMYRILVDAEGRFATLGHAYPTLALAQGACQSHAQAQAQKGKS